MLLPAVCMISLPYVNSNWSYSPETAKLVVDLCDLDLWPLTLTFCMDITFDHGNNSWKFHDETMLGTWWKRCDRRTERQTDGQTENTICRAAWSQLKNNFHTMTSLRFIAMLLWIHRFQKDDRISILLAFLLSQIYRRGILNCWLVSPPDKMAAIPQTIFSNAFSWMISLVFWFEHWNLFLRVQLTISQHWLG